MRILGLILAILGGLAAGFLGMKWMGDANSLKASIEFARKAGANMAELDKMATASYMLIGAMVAGIVGGILAVMGKGKIAALLLLAGAIYLPSSDWRHREFFCEIAANRGEFLMEVGRPGGPSLPSCDGL